MKNKKQEASPVKQIVVIREDGTKEVIQKAILFAIKDEPHGSDTNIITLQATSLDAMFVRIIMDRETDDPGFMKNLREQLEGMGLDDEETLQIEKGTVEWKQTNISNVH